MLVIQLLVAGVCGIIAAAIASNKGRSAVGWFFGGFFLGLIGIIVVACLSNLKEEQARRLQAESERRRLREQLSQERHKSETYRRYSMQRLDAHDDALGLDTRSAAALPGGDAPSQALPAGGEDPAAALHRMSGATPQAKDPQPVPPPTTGPAAPRAFAEWYYEINGQTQGPVTEPDIKYLLRLKKIGPGTLLWTEQLGQWTPVSQVPTFRGVVDA